jgi:DNA mismatch repair protein MutL
MNRIRLLPEHVANQIAAGEVVERPASVVKELVENALDAGASRIAVEIQAGGRSLIRVTDDGSGMSRDDALLAFERHATSKIQRAEDLQAIATMGFRGEALPSLASVSRLALTTREAGADGIEATQVILHGGKLLDVRTAAGAAGTSVEVRQLFFNLPARRKFLRSEETERAHIHHYLTLAAVAHPHVGFTFTHDQRLVWRLPPVPCGQNPGDALAALRERLRALYGGERSLVPVDFTRSLTVASPPDLEAQAGAEPDPEPGALPLRVWGFIGAPGVSRSTRDEQHLFVNRRPVENRALNHALLEGYHTSLMKGRFPVTALFLELSPALVDVNIHPAKREVKFREERQVRGIVTQAVRRALLGYHAATAPPTVAGASHLGPAPATEPDAGSASKAGAVTAAPAMQRPLDLNGRGIAPASTTGPAIPATTAPPIPAASNPVIGQGAESASSPVASGRTERDTGHQASQVPGDGARRQSADGSDRDGHAPQGLLNAPGPSAQPANPPPLLQVPLRLVGVIGRLYVVLESDRGLVLLDQHAAHERVLFERVLAQLDRGAAPCQRLLLPETVELSPRDASFLREQLPTLNRLGVSLREFGERTFLLDGLPPFVRVGHAREFVVALVDELKAAGNEVNSLRLGEPTVAKTVCRHAVKANDALGGPELLHLVEDLRRCSMPYTCPHGRPTMIEFNWRELEKKFGRSQ